MKLSVISWSPEARPHNAADCEGHVPWFCTGWTDPA